MKKFIKVFLMLSSFSSLVSAVSCFEIKLGDPFGNGIGSGEGDSKLDPNDKPEAPKRKYSPEEEKIYNAFVNEDNYLSFENASENFLLPNQKYFFQDLALDENADMNFNSDLLINHNWKKLLQKPYISLRNYNKIKKLDESTEEKKAFKNSLIEFIDNEFVLDDKKLSSYLVNGKLFSLVRKVLNNEISSETGVNIQFANDLLEFFDKKVVDYNSYFYRDEIPESDLYKKSFVRFWEGEDEIIEEYDAIRIDLDGLSSTYNEFLKLGINDLMINQKRDVMNYWINDVLEINNSKTKESDLNITRLDNPLFQLSFGAYSLGDNDFIKRKYNWKVNPYDERYQIQVKNLRKTEIVEYGPPNMIDLLFYSGGKKFKLETKEKNFYIKALKFYLANHKLISIVPLDEEISLYLSKIANGVITLDGDNQNIYNDWINALDEYKDVIVKFLSMNTFNLTETKLPKYKNNFVAVDLLPKNKFGDFEYTYRFANNELHDVILPFYTVLNKNDTTLNQFLPGYDLTATNLNKPFYDYIHYYLNYLFENSKKAKSKQKVYRLNYDEYKVNLRSLNNQLANAGVKTFINKIKNIFN